MVLDQTSASFIFPCVWLCLHLYSKLDLFISSFMSFSIFHQPEMKNSQRTTGVRQYNKSEFPRLRWTPELHDHFVEVVERLGGKYSKPFFLLVAVRIEKLTEKNSIS